MYCIYINTCIVYIYKHMYFLENHLIKLHCVHVYANIFVHAKFIRIIFMKKIKSFNI